MISNSYPRLPLLRCAIPCLALIAAGLTATAAFAQNAKEGDGFTFEDVTDKEGLGDHLRNWRVGHSGAWGDVNGDGRPELYLGAFADRPLYRQKDSPIPNPLFLNLPDGFELSPDETVRLEGVNARTSYSMMVDLDNDGDLDLAAITHAADMKRYQSQLFENDGKGNFTVRTPKGGGWPRPLAARNVAPIDFDDDGLLDLLVSDGSYSGIFGGTGRVYALRQVKPFEFEDVTKKMNLPMTGAAANGLAVGDVNNDGDLDFFLTQSNRMFVSSDKGYREVKGVEFVGPRSGDREAMTCGAAFGDIDGNGLLDLVTAVHGQPATIDVYLNQGVRNGMPQFVNVTKPLGLDPMFPKESAEGLPVKAAHVALKDFNNDGRNDIMISVIYRDENGKLQPVVLRNLGNDNKGLPQFTKLPLKSMYAYYAQAPVADYDGDGRLDIFLPTWFDEVPSMLMRNTSEAGNYLAVTVEGKGKGMNRQGIGATVRAYEAGHAGDDKHLLGRQDITLGNGYSSGELAEAHFGLADRETVDVVVNWQGKTVTQKDVKAGQKIHVVME